MLLGVGHTYLNHVSRLKNHNVNFSHYGDVSVELDVFSHCFANVKHGLTLDRCVPILTACKVSDLEISLQARNHRLKFHVYMRVSS